MGLLPALAIAAGISLVIVLALALVFGVPIFGGSSSRANIQSIVASQRDGSMLSKEKRQRVSIFESAAQSSVRKTASARWTLQKRLKYAQWTISPIVFRLLQFGISIVSYLLISIWFDLVVQAFSLLIGVFFMNWLLDYTIDRRYKAFDQDYPQFLLSLVGLLKTGMNTMQAIEAAAQALEDGSLLKQEVTVMNDRLRFGVSEDRSIGSFGEDIAHPEIELFVQALLLSRRVGGNLSDTLDRLAKQVRKRQFFRQSAAAAVHHQPCQPELPPSTACSRLVCARPWATPRLC